MDAQTSKEETNLGVLAVRVLGTYFYLESELKENSEVETESDTYSHSF